MIKTNAAMNIANEGIAGDVTPTEPDRVRPTPSKI